MSENVIRLVDYVPQPTNATPDLVSWARDWLELLARGDYGELTSLVLIAENKEGRIATVAQGVRPITTVQLVGLLTTVAHGVVARGGV